MMVYRSNPEQDIWKKAAAGRPLFASIVTTSFSGATLLAILLAAHPDIATVGEVNGPLPWDGPEEFVCSCGKAISSCEFWQAVSAKMTARGTPLDMGDFQTRFQPAGPRWLRMLQTGSSRLAAVDRLRDRLLFSLPSERWSFREIARRNAMLIQSILETTGKHIFVDSSKDWKRPEALHHFYGLDVRLIHLVRRAEGVVSSHLRRQTKDSAQKRAEMWARRHRRIESMLKAWPQAYTTLVRYEDLCTNREATLARLLAFLGAESISTSSATLPAGHVIGNPMRLRPLKIKLDERWRQELTSQQLREIREAAGTVNRFYGYD